MSIRQRMTLSLVCAMLIVLGCAGSLLYTYMRIELVGQFDDGLLTKAKSLHALLRRDKSGKVEFEFSDIAMPEFNRSNSPEYFELWTGTGIPIEHSNSLDDFSLTIKHPSDSSSVLFSDLLLPDRRPGRSVVLHATNTGDDDERRDSNLPPQPSSQEITKEFVFVVARERINLNKTLATIAWAMGSTSVFLTFVVSALVPWLVGKNLRWLDDIASRASQINVDSLNDRFPAASMPSELQPICNHLNDTLERLQAAFERERRFSSDVAHELRTPIAELRLLSEVAIKFPNDSKSVTQSFSDALDIAKQMQMIVNSLLEMMDGDRAATEPMECEDLCEMARDAWTSINEQAVSKGIRLQQSGLDSAATITNGIIVRRILVNLFDNAIEYAPDGSTVECDFVVENGQMTLRIGNLATNVTEADIPFLAQPFWRKDASRTGGRHCGLGLSLVNCYARRLRIGVDFACSPQGHFHVKLTFPTPSEC